MIVKWLLRSLFVLLLVGAGLWTERHFYSRYFSSGGSILTKDKSTLRILFYGGSQIIGIPEFFKTSLERKFPSKKFEVSAAIFPDFIARKLNDYHSFITRQYHPDYILSIISCPSSEGDINYEPNSGLSMDRRASVDPFYAKLAFFSLPQSERLKISPREYANRVKDVLIELVNRRDLENLKTFGMLFPEKDLKKSERAFIRKILREQLRRLLNDGIQNYRDWRIYQDLILISDIVQRQLYSDGFPLPENDRRFYQRYGNDPDAIKNLESEVFIPGTKFIDDGLSYIRRFGCEKFIEENHISIEINRYWLCGLRQWIDANPGEKQDRIIERVLSNPRRFYVGFSPRQIEKAPPPKSVVNEKYFSLGATEMRRLSEDKFADLDQNDLIPHPKVEEEFFSNVQMFNSSALALHQKFILLQSPNINDDIVTQAGIRFNIPVFGSLGIFDKGIKNEGRENYFTDYLCRSGHLTPKAAQIFADRLAENFVEYLRQKKNVGK